MSITYVNFTGGYDETQDRYARGHCPAHLSCDFTSDIIPEHAEKVFVSKLTLPRAAFPAAHIRVRTKLTAAERKTFEETGQIPALYGTILVPSADTTRLPLPTLLSPALGALLGAGDSDEEIEEYFDGVFLLGMPDGSWVVKEEGHTSWGNEQGDDGRWGSDHWWWIQDWDYQKRFNWYCKLHPYDDDDEVFEVLDHLLDWTQEERASFFKEYLNIDITEPYVSEVSDPSDEPIDVGGGGQGGGWTPGYGPGWYMALYIRVTDEEGAVVVKVKTGSGGALLTGESEWKVNDEEGYRAVVVVSNKEGKLDTDGNIFWFNREAEYSGGGGTFQNIFAWAIKHRKIDDFVFKDQPDSPEPPEPPASSSSYTYFNWKCDDSSVPIPQPVTSDGQFYYYNWNDPYFFAYTLPGALNFFNKYFGGYYAFQEDTDGARLSGDGITYNGHIPYFNEYWVEQFPSLPWTRVRKSYFLDLRSNPIYYGDEDHYWKLPSLALQLWPVTKIAVSSPDFPIVPQYHPRNADPSPSADLNIPAQKRSRTVTNVPLVEVFYPLPSSGSQLLDQFVVLNQNITNGALISLRNVRKGIRSFQFVFQWVDNANNFHNCFVRKGASYGLQLAFI